MRRTNDFLVGLVVLLVGATLFQFATGILNALDFDIDEVTSPSFTLVTGGQIVFDPANVDEMLEEYGLGGIAEVYDGDPPHRPGVEAPRQGEGVPAFFGQLPLGHDVVPRLRIPLA